MKKFMKAFIYMFVGTFAILFLVSLGGVVAKFDIAQKSKVDEPSILVMSLKGPIFDGSSFLEDLKKYASKENIKGVLVRINSPGGVVGPSQEIYTELKRVRDELQKPVVASCNAMAASGAYYAAVAADQIITNPGTLMGSIGVIMEFANLAKLYSWAKISRYVIKTGPYKDSGSEHRAMREDERMLFQSMINEVHEQFKQAVAKGRKLPRDVVDKYADGRIFTGETAVKLGFADQTGTYEDALRVVGELSGLGSEPEIFKPPVKKPGFFELIAESKNSSTIESLAEKVLKLKVVGQPLYMLPGTLGL